MHEIKSLYWGKEVTKDQVGYGAILKQVCDRGYEQELNDRLEPVEPDKQTATIDWLLKESVLATMRSKVLRLLATYDYPPDEEEGAVELVLQRAELIASAAGGDTP